METNKRKALGKGLEQLFSNESLYVNPLETLDEIAENTPKEDIVEIKVSELRSNPYQPRKTFNEESLNELATSIKQYGIVEPIIVKKSIKGYELIAGERRCKAAKIAGLTKVPAITKDFNDQEMMEIALIENIQREDLNPIDEASSVANIIKLRGMTQEEFATTFGKSRSYVTNLLGLLNLPKDVQNKLINKEISMSHARVLSKIDDEEKVIILADKVIKEKMNVRDLERYVTANNDLVKRKPINIAQSNNMKIYENAFSDKIGNKVRITKSKIEINYDSIKDLERIMVLFDINLGDD